MTTIAGGGGGSRTPTGVPGLDDILGGGLPSNRLYVVQGTPGVGKTTLALQFLLEGAARGESVLYITLSETEEEVREIASSHGWKLDGLNLYELSMAEQALRLDEENTLYSTAEVELKETIRVILQHVDSVQPTRIVFDSLSEIRLLAQSPVRYRRQLLALKQYFAGRRSTILLLGDLTGETHDMQVESLAHGVIALEQLSVAFGADRRRLRVKKLRGASYRSGYHDFVMKKGGLRACPRLVAAEHRTTNMPPPIATGVPELDALLGGGLDRAAATLLLGPAGTGKSILTTQIACAAARANLRSAVFLFEERISTLLARAASLKLDVARHVSSGLIELQQVDPAELAPDELTQKIRDAVDRGAKLVVIDSTSGYLASMPDAKHLTLQLHELLAYLSEAGVATILTMAQSGLVGTMKSPIDLSYLADNVVLLRYFESAGAIRKAISIVKRRRGKHEETIRELSFSRDGVHIGAPLHGFHGILTGIPTAVRGNGTPGLVEPHADE